MSQRVFVFLILMGWGGVAVAQSPVVQNLGVDVFDTETSFEISDPQPEFQTRSGGAAFGLSLLLPGLGHRYASGGWSTMATVHGLADAALWVGLIDSNMQIGRAQDSFETLAATSAGIGGGSRSRGFYLNLASYRSSDEYVDQLLRDRAWDQLETAQLPENQWEWASDEDFQNFRSLREDAESLRRRRPIFAAMLAGNRLLAGIGAIRASRKFNRTQAEVSLGPPPAGSDVPTVNMSFRF